MRYNIVIYLFSCLLVKLIALQSIKSKYLIIQNKGGGHGTIGYQLCKSIIQKNNNNNNIDITLIQDKCNYKTSPFQY